MAPRENGATAQRRSAMAQGDLFAGDPAVGRGRAGRVERRVSDAVKAAKLEDVDGGLAALAVELGRAVDTGTRRGDPYAVAAAARELREVLTRLRLDPTARGGQDRDIWAELSAQLGTPTMGDTAQS